MTTRKPAAPKPAASAATSLKTKARNLRVRSGVKAGGETKALRAYATSYRAG